MAVVQVSIRLFAVPEMRALICHRSTSVGNSIGDSLRACGFEVVCIERSADALCLLQYLSFDLVCIGACDTEAIAERILHTARENGSAGGWRVPVVWIGEDEEMPLQLMTDGCLRIGDSVDAMLVDVFYSTLNWDEARAMVNDDEDMFLDICKALLHEIPREMRHLEQGICNRDTGIVQCISHSFAGSLRFFGASRALACAMQLEYSARSARRGEVTDRTVSEWHKWRLTVAEYMAIYLKMLGRFVDGNK